MKNQFHNWSDVRVFLAVLRTGSTLAASKTLGLAQPTVARRIEALEHALGLTLFDRDTRGFHPTDAATLLKTSAEAIELNINALSDTALSLKNAAPKAIRFTGVPEVFTENFAAIVADFRDIHPEATFDFLATPDILDIAKGEADVAIRYTNSIKDPTLICRKISEAQTTLYASEGYINKHGHPESADNFENHKFVMMRPGMNTWRAWLEPRISPDQIAMECDSYNGMVAAILSGFGMGLIGVGLGDATEALHRCMAPLEHLGITTWLITSPQAHKRAEVRAFTKFFAPRYTAMLKEQSRQLEAKYAAS